MPLTGLFGMSEDDANDFGLGYFSLGLMHGQDVVQRAPLVPSPVKEIEQSLHLVTNEYERKDAFGLSAQASFRGFSGKGSVSASFSRRVQIDSKSMSLVLRKNVLTSKVRLYEPTLTPRALEFFNDNGAEAFLERYGDTFINSITFGASMYIVFSARADSRERAEEMRASFSGSVGPVSGGASVASSVFERIARNEVMMDTFTVGVDNAPDAGKFEAIDDERTQTILAYYDSLEQRVRQESGLGVARQYDFMKTKMAYDAPANLMLDLDDGTAAIREALDLKQQIANVRADFEEARDNLQAFQGREAEIAASLADLATKEDQLEDFADELFLHPVEAPRALPFTKEQLPDLPPAEIAPYIAARFFVSDFEKGGETQKLRNGEVYVGKGVLGNAWCELATFDQDLKIILLGIKLGQNWEREQFEANFTDTTQRFLIGIRGFRLEGAKAPYYKVGTRFHLVDAKTNERTDTGWLWRAEDFPVVVGNEQIYVNGLGFRLKRLVEPLQ